MPHLAMTARLPKLSELGVELVHVTRWQVARAIATPMVAFIAYWAFAGSGHWVGAILSLMVLSFTTYGSTSHDLVHSSLGLGRRTNDVALCILELIALRSGHAYQAAHLHHHANFPSEDDIEAEAARMNLPRALLEGLVFQFRIYAWALRNDRGRRRRWIIGEGIALGVIILGAIVALPWTAIPGVYLGLMIAGSWVIPLITSYLPHNPEAPDVLLQTRLFRGVVARVLAVDHLYHLEHHLYPAVPHQNWPQLAQRLNPWFDAAGITPIRVRF